MTYLLNGRHEFLFTFDIFLHLDLLREGFPEIFIIFLPDFLFHDFLDGVKMVVLEHVIFKLLELLIAERTTVVPVDCLFDASLAVYMPTSRYVTVVDRVEANCALEFGFQFLWVYFEVYVVLVFVDHLSEKSTQI